MDVIGRGTFLAALPNLGHASARLIAGLLLMTAGAGKLVLGGPLLFASSYIVPHWAVGLIGMAELVIGWLSLSMVASPLLRVFLPVLFGAFAGALLLEQQMGASFCQCFSGYRSQISVVLLVDAALLALLAWFAFRGRAPELNALGPLAGPCRGLKVVWPMVLVAVTWWYGSPSAASAYFAGHDVVTASPDQFAGTLSPGESVTCTFWLTNTTVAPVEILGAESSCRCFATDDLPMTLPPATSLPLRLRLAASQEQGVQRESTQVIFGHARSRLILNVAALVEVGL